MLHAEAEESPLATGISAPGHKPFEPLGITYSDDLPGTANAFELVLLNLVSASIDELNAQGRRFVISLNQIGHCDPGQVIAKPSQIAAELRFSHVTRGALQPLPKGSIEKGEIGLHIALFGSV